MVLEQPLHSVISHPNTLQELKAALLEKWALLLQAFIDTLINSMKAHCEACIAVHGGPLYIRQAFFKINTLSLIHNVTLYVM